MTQNADWVNAGRPPVIPGTKAHACALSPLGLYLLHFSWFNFFLCVLMVGLAIFITVKGRTIGWYWRRMLSKLRNGRMSAWPLYIRRRMQWTSNWSSIKTEMLRR